jgi:monothiol glutaredoxin
MSDVQADIRKMVDDNRVILFMKGTAQQPMCGFSFRAVEVIRRLGVPFVTVDVLSDPAIREGIKTFSSWPTIPQLYIDGQFIGGSDIVMEMYESGELQKLLAAG